MDSSQIQNGTDPSSNSLSQHRLLENRSKLSLNIVQEPDHPVEVKGHGVEPKRNWIPRRRHSSNNVARATTVTAGMTRRCVCNLSQCASTNYMCKSERQVLSDGTEIEGGCFIEPLPTATITATVAATVESSPKPTSARRGCIEMLSREKQQLCKNSTQSDLQCCFNEDMCNYPKTFYSNPASSPVFPAVNRIPFEPTAGRLNNLDHEVWLRAAVIAVPICGLIILILLIYVARKLLKSEDDYKQNGGYSRKFQYNHPKTHELLLPHHPTTLELSPPQVSGHCFWCSAHGPRSTTYLLPDHQDSSPLRQFVPTSLLGDSLMNHLQDEPTNHYRPMVSNIKADNNVDP